MLIRKNRSEHCENFVRENLQYHRYNPKLDVSPIVKQAMIEEVFMPNGDSTSDWEGEDIGLEVNDLDVLRNLADSLENDADAEQDLLRAVVRDLQRFDRDQEAIEIIGTKDNYCGFSAHGSALGHVWIQGLEMSKGDTVKLKIIPWYSPTCREGTARRSFIVRGKVEWCVPEGCDVSWFVVGEAEGIVMKSHGPPARREMLSYRDAPWRSLEPGKSKAGVHRFGR